MQEPSHSQWSGKTDGTPWMQNALIGMYRYMPLRLLYGVMALVVPFYMIFNRRGYKAMYSFFRKRMGYGPFKSFFSVYGNHYNFGMVILDRFAVYAGKKFSVTVDGQELFDNLECSEKGFIMLSSHVGCYELAGYSLVSKHKTFNAIVYAGESQAIMKNRDRILREHNMRMIPVMGDMSHLFAINAALDNNEILSMPADRLFGSSKSVTCKFFGEDAKFPKGAYALAKAKDVKMLAVFVMKEKAKRYHAYVREVADANGFATELEQIVRKYPKQWYNYFDFWNQG
ncbi:MAG: lysophospholipid acyltransferase family protein [Bacteroidales bacterium]|nr:lysophospholipid acyltransferase family protein [Bacteroidales bacterium]